MQQALTSTFITHHQHQHQLPVSMKTSVERSYDIPYLIIINLIAHVIAAEVQSDDS